MHIKKSIVVLILLLFMMNFIQSASATLPVQSNPNPPNTSQLTSDLTQLCIDLNDSDGDNMYWEIRQNSNVLENGTPFSYPTHTYDFTDHVNNTARYECSATPLRMTSETTFSSTEYTNISTVDNLNVTTNCTTYDWSHHHFIFNLSENRDNITNIAVNWHGYAGAYGTGAKPKWYWDANMYVKKGSWGLVDSTVLYTGTPHLEWLNWSDGDSGYITPDGVLEVAIENTNGGKPSIVLTDYIEVIITYRIGGDPNGTYCTDNISFWNNDTCEEWWVWDVCVDDGSGLRCTHYRFQNSPCVFSGFIRPQNNATGICPCCDSICFGVGGLYSNVNATVYGRSQNEVNYTIWNKYINITNNTYCFCLEGYIIDHWHQPMQYNTTYYWYVNITDIATGDGENSSIFTFTTEEDINNCIPIHTSDTMEIITDAAGSIGVIVFFIFTLVAFIILLLKLVNVMQFANFYDKEWSVVGFVGEIIAFTFILFLVLNDAGEHVEFISYLWVHIAMFTIITILTISEILMWFYIILPKQPGGEKYGDRRRLIIDREK